MPHADAPPLASARPAYTRRRTEPLMGTLVTIDVVSAEGDAAAEACDQAIARAFGWFHEVERRCTRFDPDSEVMSLTHAVGQPVAVSGLLYEAVRFALAVAEDSGGAFDPTVGYRLETLGFNRHYRTGAIVHTALDAPVAHAVTYRDVAIDTGARTITLRRPLIFDLGAVAKGLAIDMAARELARFERFVIEAGGDLFAGGTNPAGRPWSVGISHPRQPGALIGAVSVSNRAVCTSGDYERRAADGGGHILDARTGRTADAVASVTIVATTAMAADAIGTAAFVLGAIDGLAFLERQGVEGLIVTPSLDVLATPGLARDYGFSR